MNKVHKIPQERFTAKNGNTLITSSQPPVELSLRGSSSVLFRQNPIYHPSYRNTYISSWDRTSKCLSEQGHVSLAKKSTSEVKSNSGLRESGD